MSNRKIPDDDQLWSVADIAHYLNLTEPYVRRSIVSQPWFPVPIVLGVGHARWYPTEVKERLDKHRKAA